MCDKGGKGFAKPITPATSRSITDQVSYYCGKSGIQKTGYTSIRHKTANVMASVIGIEGTPGSHEPQVIYCPHVLHIL